MVSSGSISPREGLYLMLQVWIHENRTRIEPVITGLFCLVTAWVFFQTLTRNPAIFLKQQRFEFMRLADGSLVHWRGRRSIKPSSRVYISAIFANRMASLRKGWNPVHVPGNFVGIVTPDLAPKLKGVCGMCCSLLILGVFFSKQLKQCLWIYKFTRMDIKDKRTW